MSEHFDPYYTWLGIPPEEQPPDHYRLLGIRRFENNAEAIANAVEQKTTHLRSHLGGPRAPAAEGLLKELSQARECLLNPDRKGAYDRELRQKDAPKVSKEQSSQSFVKPPAPRKPPSRASAAVASATATVPVSDSGLVPVAMYPADPLFAEPAPQAYYPQPPAKAWHPPGSHRPLRPLWQQPLVLFAAVLVGMSVMGVIAVGAIIIGWQMLPRGNSRPPNSVAGIPPTQIPPRNPNWGPSAPVRPGVKTPPTYQPPKPAENKPLSFSSDATSDQLVQPAVGGFALQFNSSPAYVEVENSQEIATLDNPTTIELWARWQDDGQGQTLMGNMWAQTERDAEGRLRPWTGWSLCAKRERGANQILHFYTMGTGPYGSGLNMNAVADESRWHHFAYTCDGLGAELYIDGRKARQRVKQGVKGNQKQNLCLGASKSADPSFSRLRGEICAFRISSKKRYTRHFEPPTTFEKDADTIGLLDFSRSQGDKIEDVTGQGHHGLITGAAWVAR
jgi:hypothetical protein